MAPPQNGRRGGMTTKPPPAEDMSNKTFNDLFESRFLSPPDIKEQSMVVEIERVMKEPIANLQTFKWNKVTVIYFKGIEKPLKLPKTQGDVLKGLFGYKMVDWIGKKVRIVPVEESYFGTTHFLVRIAEEKVNQSEPAMNAPKKEATGTKASREQIEAMETFAGNLYGDETGSKLATLAHAVSRKRTNDYKDLFVPEAQRLIDGMLEKMEQQDEEEPELEM